jgi:hypothetical protein
LEGNQTPSEMKDELNEFLEWLPNNITHLFEIIDNPKEVVDKYLKAIGNERV